MREVAAVLGGMAAVVIVLTVLAGGDFGLGTGPAGPYAAFGYKGRR